MKECKDWEAISPESVFNFYGVCDHCFKLDDLVWEAEEDEDDGYRSYMGSVTVAKGNRIFFQSPIARVRVVRQNREENVPWTKDGEYSFDGWALVDAADGHKWLVFGTTNNDDYYPWFTFEYSPKPAEAIK